MARLSADKWNEIKAIYALGQEPVLSIAERFGVSHTAINKKAKVENWERLDGHTVSKAIESRAALKSEVSKVSKSMKLETLHVETEIDRIASTKDVMNRVKDNMAKVADVFAASLAERAETSVIESVEDMKPFMAMSQLVNEAMKTPMKMVELETKQPEQNIELDEQPRLIIQSNAIRD